MELALDLGLETVHSRTKSGISKIAGSRKLPPVMSRWRRRQAQRRRAHDTVIFGSAEPSREDSWSGDSDFTNRPPIEIPDDLIFPVCVFCGYSRSYEAEFGRFNRMGCDAEIYCHEGC